MLPREVKHKGTGAARIGHDIIAAIVEMWCTHCGADVGISPGPAADKAVDLAVAEKCGALLRESDSAAGMLAPEPHLIDRRVAGVVSIAQAGPHKQVAGGDQVLCQQRVQAPAGLEVADEQAVKEPQLGAVPRLNRAASRLEDDKALLRRIVAGGLATAPRGVHADGHAVGGVAAAAQLPVVLWGPGCHGNTAGVSIADPAQRHRDAAAIIGEALRTNHHPDVLQGPLAVGTQGR